MLRREKPYRVSALHRFHLSHGAEFGWVGDWWIPLAYADRQEEQAAAELTCALVDISPVRIVEVLSRNLEVWLADRFGLETPVAIGQMTRVADTVIMRLSLERAWLRQPNDSTAGVGGIARVSRVSGSTTVLDVSHGYTAIGLLGPHAWEALSMRTQAPVAPSQFPSGSVLQAGVADVRGVIARRDQGQRPVYELYVGRQYGLYVWEQLCTAVRRMGGSVAGWETWCSNVEGEGAEAIPAT